jgi:hypothetical protein
LERCFRENYDESPQQWLDQVRLWQAACSLVEGRRPKEILSELGLASESSFYHAFKQYYQCTPLEYVTARFDPNRRNDVATLRLHFPGERVPAGTRHLSEPRRALAILERRLDRSTRLLLYRRRAQAATVGRR